MHVLPAEVEGGDPLCLSVRPESYKQASSLVPCCFVLSVGGFAVKDGPSRVVLKGRPMFVGTGRLQCAQWRNRACEMTCPQA